MPDSFQTFAAIVTAIFVEAMPFLAVGALLSAAIEVLIPSDRILRYIPRGRFRGILLGIFAGMLIPTCECGVVPVVRRLMKKGVPGHVAIAYMLSAPIVNPIVLASTWVAFPGRPEMVAARLAVASVVATAMGLIAARIGPVLRNGGDDDGNDGNGACRGHGHADGHSSSRPAGKVLAILRHGSHEFLDMGKFLILGAVAAGAFKTYLPQGIILALAENGFAQVAGMMGLAILLSVCSEADSFVAASFQVFSPASQLAFISIGPMVDLKLIGMYAITFRRPLFWCLMTVPAVLVLLLSLAAGVVL